MGSPSYESLIMTNRNQITFNFVGRITLNDLYRSETCFSLYISASLTRLRTFFQLFRSLTQMTDHMMWFTSEPSPFTIIARFRQFVIFEFQDSHLFDIWWSQFQYTMKSYFWHFFKTVTITVTPRTKRSLGDWCRMKDLLGRNK